MIFSLFEKDGLQCGLTARTLSGIGHYTLDTNTTTLTFGDCSSKGGDPTPELVIPAETETEITAFPDRITIKDAPANTKYQIYNTIGQLIQTGATNPDISTANLNKGVYILRLENGKTVKFVR